MEKINNITEDGIATIYLYDIIGDYFDEETNQVKCKINGLEIAKEIEYLQTNAKQINVRINSAGGNVLCGYAIYDAIRNSKIPVFTYNVGVCASIAGIVFLGGHRRFMYDYSTLMIHNPSTPGVGDNSKLLSVIKEQLVTILNNNSILTEKKIASLMAEETYFDADEAKKLGLIDEKIITNRITPKINKTNIAEMFNVYNQLEISEEMKKNKIEEEKLETVALEEVVNAAEPKAKKVKAKKETAKEEKAEDPEEEKSETPEEEKEEESAEDSENSMAPDMTLDEAKKEIKALKAVVDKFEAEKSKEKADKVKNMLNTFVSAKKITETEVPALTTLANVDFDSVYNMLSKINPAPVSINKEATKIFNQTPVLNNFISGKESWTIRDWEKKDSKGLEKLKQESPELYMNMFNEFYKKTK